MIRADHKSKLVATGLLVGVFASGILVGGAGRAMADRTERGSDNRERMSFVEWLETEMMLNSRQETAIHVILDQYNQDMHDLWAEVRPRSEEIRQRARTEITGILEPDQREIYAQMNARRDSLRAERRNQRDDDE